MADSERLLIAAVTTIKYPVPFEIFHNAITLLAIVDDLGFIRIKRLSNNIL